VSVRTTNAHTTVTTATTMTESNTTAAGTGSEGA